MFHSKFSLAILSLPLSKELLLLSLQSFLVSDRLLLFLIPLLEGVSCLVILADAHRISETGHFLLLQERPLMCFSDSENDISDYVAMISISRTCPFPLRSEGRRESAGR
jgi:hypothetical protein